MPPPHPLPPPPLQALATGLKAAGVDASNEQLKQLLSHASALGYLRRQAGGGGSRYAPLEPPGGAAVSDAEGAMLYARAVLHVLYHATRMGRTHITATALAAALGISQQFAIAAAEAMEVRGEGWGAGRQG